MTMKYFLFGLLLLICGSYYENAEAFVVHSPTAFVSTKSKAPKQIQTSTSLRAFDPNHVLDNAHSLLLSGGFPLEPNAFMEYARTNKYLPVFLGGLSIAFGSLFAIIMVGNLLRDGGSLSKKFFERFGFAGDATDQMQFSKPWLELISDTDFWEQIHEDGPYETREEIDEMVKRVEVRRKEIFAKYTFDEIEREAPKEPNRTYLNDLVDYFQKRKEEKEERELQERIAKMKSTPEEEADIFSDYTN